MNGFTAKKESIRLYQNGRKEQIRQRNCGRRNSKGGAENAEGLYGQLIREFMGTCVENREVKLYPAENLI
ncbi:MAG TPA: hypothetical protein PK358_11150 [Spirochaetota bacterium]|nr:hypothetical protein [Spirochaetota bacterium]HPJ35385.1 hypothetical protein [Spirochaetota bacterium]